MQVLRISQTERKTQLKSITSSVAESLGSSVILNEGS
jgi:hypothetical protein